MPKWHVPISEFIKISEILHHLWHSSHSYPVEDHRSLLIYFFFNQATASVGKEHTATEAAFSSAT